MFVLKKLRLLLISARPNTWLRIWSEMIIAAALASSTNFNWISYIFTFVAASPLLWSAAYMLNDVSDITYDKNHPLKRKRPISSGELNKNTALIFIILLTLSSYTVGYLVNSKILYILLGMSISQILYTHPSIRFKQIALLDITTNGINSVLRFLLGWYSQNTNSDIPLIVLLLFVSFKVALFLGHRLQSKSLEIKENYKSTVSVLPTKLLLAIIILFLFLTILFYGLSIATNIFPTISLLSLISGIPLIFNIRKNKNTFVKIEANTRFRTALYTSFFLWANITAYFILRT